MADKDFRVFIDSIKHPKWDWRVTVTRYSDGETMEEFASGGWPIAEAVARRLMHDLGGTERNPPYGPGKFDNILDNALYLLSLDGPDAECGNSGEGDGWYGLMLNVTREDLAPSPEVRRYMRAEEINFPLHAIIFEDSRGFVSVNYYESAKEAEEEWEEIERECAEMYGEED
jgi:hypothetical protein